MLAELIKEAYLHGLPEMQSISRRIKDKKFSMHFEEYFSVSTYYHIFSSTIYLPIKPLLICVLSLSVGSEETRAI